MLSASLFLFLNPEEAVSVSPMAVFAQNLDRENNAELARINSEDQDEKWDIKRIVVDSSKNRVYAQAEFYPRNDVAKPYGLVIIHNSDEQLNLEKIIRYDEYFEFDVDEIENRLYTSSQRDRYISVRDADTLDVIDRINPRTQEYCKFSEVEVMQTINKVYVLCNDISALGNSDLIIVYDANSDRVTTITTEGAKQLTASGNRLYFVDQRSGFNYIDENNQIVSLGKVDEDPVVFFRINEKSDIAYMGIAKPHHLTLYKIIIFDISSREVVGEFQNPSHEPPLIVEESDLLLFHTPKKDMRGITILNLTNNEIASDIVDLGWGNYGKILAVDEKNNRLYASITNGIVAYNLDKLIQMSNTKQNEPKIADTNEESNQSVRCGEGTVMRDGKCVAESSDNSMPVGLQEGQWAKFQISSFEVDSNAPFMSGDALKQAFIEKIIPKGDSGVPLDTKWLRLHVDDVGDQTVTFSSYLGFPDGSEKKLITQTVLVDKSPLAIPVGLKEGDTIKIDKDQYKVREELQMEVGDKKIDALRLVSNQVTSDSGVTGEIRLEHLYHKQTGMLLMINNEAHARGGGYSFNMLFVLNVVDISDHFQKELTLDSGGGCLIATATYGTELAPQVQQLREIRDNILLKTEAGTSFMNGFNQFYYWFSPTIADWEHQNPTFKEAVKVGITPMIISLSLLDHIDSNSEEKVLGYGAALILLNVAIYFVTPIYLINTIKRRFQN